MNVLTLGTAVFTLLFSASLPAAEAMSADAIKHLLTNNTMHGKDLKQKRSFTSYFKDDGIVIKRNDRSKLKTGYWHINDKGEHCMDWGKGDRCRVIVDLGNNTYQIMGGNKPKVEFTVTQGNTKRL